jgi:hypothetical protein
MPNEMRAVAEQFGNQFTIELGIVGATRRLRSAMTRAIRHD